MHPKNPLLQFLGLRPTGDLGGLTAYTTRTNRTTWFLKAPPKTKPSELQRAQRNRFRAIADIWQRLTPQQRQTWRTATARAHLTITHYNLWLYYWTTLDLEAIRTIEHQTSLELPGIR